MFVERDVEAGRTFPRTKAGPVNARELTTHAASATPVNMQDFTILSRDLERKIDRVSGSSSRARGGKPIVENLPRFRVWKGI